MRRMDQRLFTREVQRVEEKYSLSFETHELILDIGVLATIKNTPFQTVLGEVKLYDYHFREMLEAEGDTIRFYNKSTGKIDATLHMTNLCVEINPETIRMNNPCVEINLTTL